MAKKAKGPKPKRGGQSKKAAEQVLKSGALRKKGARDRALPGMEDVRIKALDEVCADIADTREQINKLKGEEAALETSALGLLRKHDRATWTHSGVTIIRVPGEETLQVKNSRKRKASAEVDTDSYEDDVIDTDDEVRAMDAGGKDSGSDTTGEQIN